MGRRLVYDVEADGFLDALTKIHCLILRDVDTDEVFQFADSRQTRLYPDITEGFEMMKRAGLLIAHNGIKYDLPAMQKVYTGLLFPELPIEVHFDTLLMVRLIWSNIVDRDHREHKRRGFPAAMIGLHSLEAWGHRMGIHKGSFDGPWECWSQPMQDYCVQDTKVGAELFKLIEKRGYPAEPIETEHELAFWLAQQERNGFKFNVEGAVSFYAKLSARREEVTTYLKDNISSWIEPVRKYGKIVVKTPNRTPRYRRDHLPEGVREVFVGGAPHSKIKLVPFNPGSRLHIANRMTKLFGWQPTEFTDSGQPKVDDSVLDGFTEPEAKACAEYLLLDKRIGALAEGKQAWLKLEKNGYVHGSVNQLGTITHRATHSKPNMTQVPSIENQNGPVPYGPECRALFGVPPGFRLVGIDASGLELRCLAHYMARYDGGVYSDLVLNGDVHTATLEAGRPHLKVRQQAKVFIYAFLYGAGNVKIGSIVLPLGSEEEQEALGKKLKKKFLQGMPALGNLIDAVQDRAKKSRFLTGLDGRQVFVRHQHAALNTLLQSAGSIICKRWMIETQRAIKTMGLRAVPWPSLDWSQADYGPCVWAHDEIQVAVREEYAQAVADTSTAIFKPLTEHFNFRCELAGEAKIGYTWKDTH